MPSHNDTLNGSWPDSFGFTIHGDGPTYVIGVKRSGLAHSAGVSPGDQVLELDGHDVSDMSAEAIKKLAYHSRNIPPTIGNSYISLNLVTVIVGICLFTLSKWTSLSNAVADRRGQGGHAPTPGPVKISHKKDGHQRQPHKFHVS